MLSLEQLDHEFIGKGDPHVESLRLKQQYEQNLTPEELQRLVEISPIVNEFMVLDFKGRTGQFPEGQRQIPIEQVPENVVNAMTRDYSDLMKVINKGK